ncbi:MAG TPA: ABC transporter substrate-binding protein [Spirochaetota bacterium]|nr:ABC transporter substrate-binding protein [Spirochaetota bacterium]HPS87992.1 ABC transporter substrate-binding protein [Spirochaetota bacterium]
MNSKKILLSVLLIFLMIFSGFAAKKKKHIFPPVPEFTSMPDITRITGKGKLVVAMTAADQAPFFFVNSRRVLVGLDVQIAREIADKLGVEVKFDRSAKSFDEVVTNVVQGRADVAISKLSRTFPRAKNVRFSTPYITFRHGLLLNRINAARAIRELHTTEKEYIQKFPGKLGVIEHSSYEIFAKSNFPYAKIVSFQKWEDVIAAVNDGSIDAAYRDELEIKKIIRLNPDASLRIKTALITDKSDPISIAVRWNDTNLLAFINMVIESGAFSSNAEQLFDSYGDLFLKNI